MTNTWHHVIMTNHESPGSQSFLEFSLNSSSPTKVSPGEPKLYRRRSSSPWLAPATSSWSLGPWDLFIAITYVPQLQDPILCFHPVLRQNDSHPGGFPQELTDSPTDLFLWKMIYPQLQSPTLPWNPVVLQKSLQLVALEELIRECSVFMALLRRTEEAGCISSMARVASSPIHGSGSIQ